MAKLLRAAAAAALITLAVAPAASAVPPPPLDAANVTIIHGCTPPPDNPCDPYVGPPTVSVDKTYPSRLVAWAEGIVP